MRMLNKTGSAHPERIWLAAIMLAAVAVYAGTLRFLWGRWIADTQYSIAFLVPFITGYFTYKKWPEVRMLKPVSSNWGLALIACALGMHLGGGLLDVSGPSGLSILLCILGGILYFRGAATIKTLAFPLAYLLFLLPIPGGILDMVGFPLQLWASGSTAFLLRTFGMEVERSGVNLSVPGYNFQVAQACSGLSSLVALIGVTAVFAYISGLPNRYRWALFLLALPIALAANVIRITTIALVGYTWGPDIAGNIYHDMSSPILFIAAICLLFALRRIFEWSSQSRATS